MGPPMRYIQNDLLDADSKAGFGQYRNRTGPVHLSKGTQKLNRLKRD